MPSVRGGQLVFKIDEFLTPEGNAWDDVNSTEVVITGLPEQTPSVAALKFPDAPANNLAIEATDSGFVAYDPDADGKVTCTK